MRAPLRGALHVLERCTEPGKSVVASVFHVFEKVCDHGRWDHVADVIRPLDALHGDPDDGAFRHDGTSAVAGIDRGVDLHGQQIAIGLSIRVDLDSRDDTGCDRQRVAADRKTIDDDVLLERRHLAEGRRGRAVEKPSICDFEQGEVGVVTDERHPCGKARAAIGPLDLDADRALDDVRVREDAVVGDDHARAARKSNALRLPRREQVWRIAHDVELDDARRALCASRLSRELKREEE
jgi:hypothetical protein